jgi:hypothetical protein
MSLSRQSMALLKACEFSRLSTVRLQARASRGRPKFRQALTRTINAYANEYKLLNEAKGERLTAADHACAA